MTMDRQLAVEKRMKRLGQERHQRNVNRAVEADAYSTLGGGQALLRRVVLPLAEAVERWLVECVEGGQATSRVEAAKYLQAVPFEVAAFLGASSVIDLLPKDPTVTAVTLAIGERIEDEVRFGALRQEAPGLYATLQSSFTATRSRSERYRKRVLAHYANVKGLDWKAWPKAAKVHVGAKLLDLLIETSGFVELVDTASGVGRKRTTTTRVRATQAALDVIRQVDARLSARPHYLPTLVAPRPWTSPKRGDGGYFYLNRPLVKEYSRAFQEELAATDMPQVLRAVNALQETAWRVNQRVLDTVLAIWESSTDVEYEGHAPLRPRSVLEELPPILEAATGEEKRRQKRERAAIHARNIERRRHVIAAANTIRTAVEYRDADAFFFPYQLDFRGRAYTMPAGLTPQGDDLAKGLLTFADAVPLGEDGVDWLAIHGANSFGIDKVPFEERIAWVGENERMILACAEDPLEHREWMAADSPFVFLAFCFEWSAAVASGCMEAFESSLPVGVDGSCNGLQHFSAMLRDPVGGTAVNLIPDERPHDVYGEVLAAVKAKLEAMVERVESPDDIDVPDALRAQAWLNSGLLVRDLVKRPTMTLPYGCTRKGIEEQIMDDVVRPALASGKAPPFPDDASGWRHVSWLAGIVWEAMGEVVIAARAAMAWLQEVAAKVSETGEPMVWRTPVGFPVRHFEVKRKKVEVRTAVGGKRLSIILRELTPKVDPGAMRLGVSPHFVHALDATHLYLTVNAALDLGVEAFSMVHDSYGTHAANVALLGEVLRDTFVRLYTDHHPLAELAAELAARGIEVPELPRMGNLDLEQVRRSPFFFA